MTGSTKGFPEGFADARTSRSSVTAVCSIVHAGGKAGLFSGIIGGWVSGASGSQTTTVEVRT